MRVRLPAHAGTFYPATPEELIRMIEWSFTHRLGPGALPPRTFSEPMALAYVAPHAGYMYSGPVAAHVYYDLSLRERPDVVVIVGPNHTGLGAPVSVWREGVWRTPLGDVEVDSEAARLMVEYGGGYLAFDEEGHLYEHSVEVQIPFLQYVLGGDFKIVPIVVLNQLLDVALRIAEAYLKLRFEAGVKALLLATSDLNHYEPYDVTVEKDLAVLKAVETGSAEEVYRVIEELRVSACGPAALAAATHVGGVTGRRPVVLKYANSGDVTGEKSWVVGYPAIRVA